MIARSQDLSTGLPRHLRPRDGMRRRCAGLFAVALAMVLVSPVPLAAQSAENVAVVINDDSPASQRVGEYYVTRRAIPLANVIRIRTSGEETIDRAQYAATIQAPIAAAIAARGLQDRVLYIVLTKGVPIRVADPGASAETVASVDSELTQLYRAMTGLPIQVAGTIPNPYFHADRPLADARPFTHREHDIYLVTRLDAFTEQEAMMLVDRAAAPVRDGRIVLDQQNKLFNRSGEDWLEQAATRLTQQGFGAQVMLERTATGVRDVKPVLGYFSWGSNDANNRVRQFGLGFAPGAIAGMFVSSDARTFREPPAAWTPTGDEDRSKWYAGTPQSLVGDLIREGVTGVAGHVAEPYLRSTVRPEILFPAYVAGFNLVEAYYLAMPHLSWQNLVIGDPLCAPFRQRVLGRTELGDGADSDTGLPALFAPRRVARLKLLMPGIPDGAVQSFARAERLLAANDRAGARSALEEATRVAPQAVPAQLQLALLHEQDQNVPAAIERYRLILATQPGHTLTLNNLAWALASRREHLDEALDLAKRAVAQAPRNPALLDTLAWVEYLSGDRYVAVRHIEQAVSGAPRDADMRLRAATIRAAVGDRIEADRHLREALKLRPALSDSAQVKEIRQQIDRPAAPAQ